MITNAINCLFNNLTRLSICHTLGLHPRWGTFLSGYAPIRDSQGTVIGLVGVDMTKTLVIEKQDFIGNTIYIVMAGGILLAGLFILLFSKTIIKDIHEQLVALPGVSGASILGDGSVVLILDIEDLFELATRHGKRAILELSGCVEGDQDLVENVDFNSSQGIRVA